MENPELLDKIKEVDSLLPLELDKEAVRKAIFIDDQPIIEEKKFNEAKTYGNNTKK